MIDYTERNIALIKFYDKGAKTLQQTGDSFNLTKERVRQILHLYQIDTHRPLKPKKPKMTQEDYAQRAIVRFWANINVTNPDECWEWKGAMHKHGYPWAQAHSIPPWHRATRGQLVAWSLANNAKPTGWIMNTCGNKMCLNPTHLTDISPKEAISKYRRTNRGKLNKKCVLTT